MAELKSPPGRLVWWHMRLKIDNTPIMRQAMTAFDAAAQCGLQLHQVHVVGWTDVTV